MSRVWNVWNLANAISTAISHAARLVFSSSPRLLLLTPHRFSTVLQILIFLPLTLATLNTSAFLLLSLLLSAHSLIHGTFILLWGSDALSVLQVPVHPFLLLVCFNAFSSSVGPWLRFAADYWGAALTFSGPLFISMEGLSSLLVVQKLGQGGKRLVGEGEVYQFALLIASAVAYVLSFWWIVIVRRVIFPHHLLHIVFNSLIPPPHRLPSLPPF
jgi:hypothetical protein